MSSTILLPHAHSFVIGPAVINTHTNTHPFKSRETRRDSELREPEPERERESFIRNYGA